MNPDDLKYHKEHSWVKVDGNRATVGITDYAQESLGDIVYMDLPDIDSAVDADGEIGEIESTKATSSVISPVSGTIVKVNTELEDTPEIINEDPYGKGWVVVIEMDNAKELSSLMDAEEYGKFVEENK
ncbi:MAG: glycine cleavage system protein GcvH [Nitrospirota bacterium]